MRLANSLSWKENDPLNLEKSPYNFPVINWKKLSSLLPTILYPMISSIFVIPGVKKESPHKTLWNIDKNKNVEDIYLVNDKSAHDIRPVAHFHQSKNKSHKNKMANGSLQLTTPFNLLHLIISLRQRYIFLL